jgi:hypothetical protein
MRRLAGVIAVVVGVAGCGGGAKHGSQPGAATRAVNDWTLAVQALQGQFQGCGARAYPTRDFIATCMKQPLGDYRRSTASTLRVVSSCNEGAMELKAVVTQVSTMLEREVSVLNRALNGRGPSAAPVADRVERAVPRDLARAHTLAKRCAVRD